MADAAHRRLTVEEFFDWNDGTETRYELIDGAPVAMAPNMGPHARIAGRVSGLIEAALKSRPECGVWLNIGVRTERANSCFVPDIAVSCEPVQSKRPELEAPILLVELLSDSTEATDRAVKIPEYQLIPTLQEILVVDPRRLRAEVHRRLDQRRWLVDLLLTVDARLRLESVGVELTLGELYAGIPID